MARYLQRRRNGSARNAVGISTNPERAVMNVIRIILAALVPPLGVFLTVGIGGAFWINLILTLFGYVPGVLHALYVIITRENARQVGAR